MPLGSLCERSREQASQKIKVLTFMRAKRAPLFMRAKRAIKLTKQTVLTFVRSEASTTYDGDFPSGAPAERGKSSRQLSEADKANRRDGGWVCPRSGEQRSSASLPAGGAQNACARVQKCALAHHYMSIPSNKSSSVKSTLSLVFTTTSLVAFLILSCCASYVSLALSI